MSHARGRLVAVLFTSLFAIVVIRSAWIHDDAYITLRTVDNFVNGYGLRWNTVERVQSYTHPLWMFLVSFVYVFTHEAFYSVIALSIALSVATAALLVVGTASSVTTGAIGVMVLTLSKAFVDYSTSGLENPLTHVLYVSFLVVLFRAKETSKSLLVLSAIAALAAVNRMDTVLLFVPVLVVLVVKTGRARGLAAVAAGFAPFILWEAFSLFYYGFLFPNTAYAKLLGSGIGAADLARQGTYYLQNSLRLDPLTLVTIGAGVVVGLRSSDARCRWIVAGIVAYLMYVVSIGGDFVTGRFLTAPLLGAVAVLARSHPASKAAIVAAAAAVIVLGFSVADPTPLRTAADGSQGKPLMDAHGIADERAYYYPFAGLLRAWQHVSVARHPWAIEGAQARQQGTPIVVRGDIGYFGYYAGPHVHVVDVWGLAEPLLARLPARRDVPWRIGHFQRAMPDGYFETLASGQNRIVDRNIAAYDDTLRLITRGPLLDGRRWIAILKMNTGHYRRLIHDAAAAQ